MLPGMSATEVPTETGEVEMGFEAFGVAAALTVSPANLLDRVRALLPPGWASVPPPADASRFSISLSDGAFVVGVDDVRQARNRDRDLALGVLDAQIRAHVAFHAPGRIFVHAGVVGHAGGAIVIPGLSFSGKTTLVAALVREGATYYSDEYAVLDEQGLVHPYPRLLSIRDGGPAGTDRSAESLGGTVGTEPLPMALLAVTSYLPGARWAPERRSPGDGAMALLANTVPARDRPREALGAVSRAAAPALVLEGERGEAAEAAADLLSR
jgi:hypothetical protein